MAPAESCFFHGDYVDGVCPGCVAIRGPLQRDRDSAGALARDIAAVLNRHGVDGAMETSDFLLGDFVVGCLEAQHQMRLRHARLFGPRVVSEVG